MILKRLVQAFFQLFLGPKADDIGNRLAIFKKNQRGNTHYAVSTRDSRAIIDIHLEKSHLVGILHRRLGGATLVLCPDDADRIREDLDGLLGRDQVFFFPDWEILPYDEFSPHEAIVGYGRKLINSNFMVCSLLDFSARITREENEA